jgi:hypothetical protein
MKETCKKKEAQWGELLRDSNSTLGKNKEGGGMATAVIERESAVRLLPVGEFSRQLGISIWTGRKMCYSGVVASNKIGRKLLIPSTEVDRLIGETLRPAVSA